MDQSNRAVWLDGDVLEEIRLLLSNDGELNAEEVERRSWFHCEIDDKSIFDDDASRLAKAFQLEGAMKFVAARVVDLLSASKSVRAYEFDASRSDIEAFQGPVWHEINLDDCLLFNLPVTCSVLRPGCVDKTIYTGSERFIAQIKSDTA